MDFSIMEIKALNNIVLSQGGKLIVPTNIIWSAGLRSGPRTTIGSELPAAFRISQKSALLKVIIQNPQGMPLDRKALKAYSGKKLFFESNYVQRNQHQNIANFRGSLKVMPKRFSRFSGNLNWKLSYKDPVGGTLEYDLIETYLELFWIYGFDSRLFCKGVPVEILRQAAYALHIENKSQKSSIFYSANKSFYIDPMKDPIIAAIAYVCFFRNAPAYDIYSTAQHFLSIPRNFKGPMAFSLTEYLKAIHNPAALCNCDDQAAAVQVYLKAIGINRTHFCSMVPFGYIRLTGLVGWGLCNSPGYIKNINLSLESPLIVEETNSERNYFFRHSFCCLPDKYVNTKKQANNASDDIHWRYCKHSCVGCRILDACIGPHSGSENIDEYINNTLDNAIPPIDDLENPENAFIYRGVTHIDWVPKAKKGTSLPPITSLKNMIKKFSKQVPQGEYFVKCTWIDPRKSDDFFNDWEIFSEPLIPGYIEVQKTWNLVKNGSSIQIDIYVNSEPMVSNACQAARNRLLTFFNAFTPREFPYEKGPIQLGNFSLVCHSKGIRTYFWPIYNVTFRVTCRNTCFNDIDLCIWLNELAINNRIESIENDLPRLDDIQNTIRIKKVKETAVVETQFPSEVLLDFVYEKGNGIQLIEQEDKKLTFIGIKKSKNIITVVVVDKNTLLTNSKQITIEVES
ncbi:MAG: hypothetical protein NT166_02905 [Candidatus Aminicenantes bacterium]|nr:hypothetical protein [Candidatus Aminicenantes bacterium]